MICKSAMAAAGNGKIDHQIRYVSVTADDDFLFRMNPDNGTKISAPYADERPTLDLRLIETDRG